ncbi:MAG TPA: MBL fold metallo-hydrolase [Polyangiaceae bacterium]|nr:MBL fold metallo-hydrolase [Polyangiaceae bacterium]
MAKSAPESELVTVTPSTSRSPFASVAPLTLVLAPALMHFAKAPAADPTSLTQCIHDDDKAPIHRAYQGTGDVQDHLGDGTRVQVLSRRTNWTHVSYVSGGEAVLGWVLSSSIEDCASNVPSPHAAPTADDPTARGSSKPASASAPPITGANECRGKPLHVKFYDVGQALAALVSLPDGRRVLVDTGEEAKRCGACKLWSEHLLSGLEADVPDKRLSLVWITHQHSDHAGNAPEILKGFQVGLYADNGTNLDSGVIDRARNAATQRGVKIRVVDPDHRDAPIPAGEGVKFTPILPTSEWPVNCEDSPNNCSIGLRLDYCNSSVLFTGDAEEEEEEKLDTRGPVTLLQVGHHGSDTSSSIEFIERVTPKYAVISSGKVDEGTNLGYCHPRLSTINELDDALGSERTGEVDAFDAAVKCKAPNHADHWRPVATSDHLWLTERDGDVELVTTGDGTFQRRAP